MSVKPKKKRKKPQRFIQLALDALTEMGWHADVCERRLTSRLTKDLFGLFDILAFKRDVVMGLQVTNYGNHGNHVTAMRKNPLLAEWLAGKDRIAEVWSYRQGVGGECKWLIRQDQL